MLLFTDCSFSACWHQVLSSCLLKQYAGYLETLYERRDEPRYTHSDAVSKAREVSTRPNISNYDDYGAQGSAVFGRSRAPMNNLNASTFPGRAQILASTSMASRVTHRSWKLSVCVRKIIVSTPRQ
jgi:hypothetical protein